MANIDFEQLSSVATFRALHQDGCFVLPNPWDAGSAVYLQHLGFKALATTSGGFAFTKALPDEVWALSRDLMLEHFQDLVQATSLPVNGDFQNGYADDPETLAANVSLCIKTGVAGLSIEDATGNKAEPLYETSLAVERVKAARRAIDESGIPVLLTARCEAWLVQRPDAQRVVVVPGRQKDFVSRGHGHGQADLCHQRRWNRKETDYCGDSAARRSPLVAGGQSGLLPLTGGR